MRIWRDKEISLNDDDTASQLFAGLITNVQIWDAAWTQADVTYAYLNPEQLALNRGGTSLTESNLKAWYPMQDGHRGQQSFILDGSNVGVGSDELITNGEFTSNDTGWTAVSDADLMLLRLPMTMMQGVHMCG